MKYAIRVTENESKALQTLGFAHGWDWSCGEAKTVGCTKSKILYFNDSRKNITHSEDTSQGQKELGMANMILFILGEYRTDITEWVHEDTKVVVKAGVYVEYGCTKIDAYEVGKIIKAFQKKD